MIKIEHKIIDTNYFPDGTLLLKYKAETKAKNITVKWFFEDNEELVKVIFLTKHLQNAGIEAIDLVLPYIPNARQDRVKKSEDIFTLKYFCEVINSLHFKNVYVLDPHSDISSALLNHVRQLPVKPYIEEAIKRSGINKDKDIIFYPDSGSQKRYGEIYVFPNAFGIKQRDWETGEIKGLDVAGQVPQAPFNVLIIDDISSFGGTFYFSAQKLKALGAEKIYLYVTHCEHRILEGKLIDSGLVEKIYTTNSIFSKEHELIEILPICIED